jgi:hypothetical protein
MNTIVKRGREAFTAVQPRGRRGNDSLLKENEKAKADILTGLYLYFLEIFSLRYRKL